MEQPLPPPPHHHPLQPHSGIHPFNNHHPNSTDSSPRSQHLEWDHHDPLPPVPGAKLRLMCSYGGRIIPRPHDKTLCYVGGETRIVVLDRHSSLADFTARLSRSLLNRRGFTLKYQLPTEDLDSLVSVTTDEDLEYMIEEYDRTLSKPNSSRLRLFLFFAKPESATSMGALLEDAKSETWFVDALNGSAEMLPRGLSDSAAIDDLLSLHNDSESSSQPEAKEVAKNDLHGAENSDSATSFPSTSNLPPIRVRAEEDERPDKAPTLPTGFCRKPPLPLPLPLKLAVGHNLPSPDSKAAPGFHLHSPDSMASDTSIASANSLAQNLAAVQDQTYVLPQQVDFDLQPQQQQQFVRANMNMPYIHQHQPVSSYYSVYPTVDHQQYPMYLLPVSNRADATAVCSNRPAPQNQAVYSSNVATQALVSSSQFQQQQKQYVGFSHQLPNNANYGYEYACQAAPEQIYYTGQPGPAATAPPTLQPLQYQTMTPAVMLTEASLQMPVDGDRKQTRTTQPV